MPDNPYLTSTAGKERNRAAAERLVRAAAGDGARLVVLPEMFNVLGDPAVLRGGAEPLDGPTLRWGRDLAGSRLPPRAEARYIAPESR